MVRLYEYYQDAGTPHAHDLLPAAFAVVRNAAGQVLLVRRIDDGNWELPGGRVEVGETARQAVVREVAEESGISIELTALSGVYSDPTHVLVDPDGSIHQQLALCFLHKESHQIVRVFGLDVSEAAEAPADVRELAELRARAREGNRFDDADQLRARIEDAGWEIQDVVEGYRLIPRQ